MSDKNFLIFTPEERKRYRTVYGEIGNEFDVDVDIKIRLLNRKSPDFNSTTAGQEVQRQEVESRLNLAAFEEAKRIKERIEKYLSCEF